MSRKIGKLRIVHSLGLNTFYVILHLMNLSWLQVYQALITWSSNWAWTEAANLDWAFVQSLFKLSYIDLWIVIIFKSGTISGDSNLANAILYKIDQYEYHCIACDKENRKLSSDEILHLFYQKIVDLTSLNFNRPSQFLAIFNQKLIGWLLLFNYNIKLHQS